MIKSVYVHIPFCKNICSYCDFCKNFYNKKIVLEYLIALEKEIKENYKGEYLDTLYIGGGTPSCLKRNELKKLFEILGNFKLNEKYEFTFECNYEDISEAFLIMLKSYGVNRISIGIQTFNNIFSKILQRKIDKIKMEEKILLAKKYFKNISVDLMYAIPGEKISDLKSDLELFLSLDVTHISTYSLIFEEHTKLIKMSLEEMDDDTQSVMYDKIVNTLSSKGYIHYEISNFSKPGFESKHNLTYWNNDEYYGFGAGASGFIKKRRYNNTKSVFNYIKGKRIVYEEYIDNNQMIKDEVMLNLRKAQGINKDEFFKKYNIKFEELFDYLLLIKRGLLKETHNNIYIPENKLFVSNEIIINLLKD